MVVNLNNDIVPLYKHVDYLYVSDHVDDNQGTALGALEPLDITILQYVGYIVRLYNLLIDRLAPQRR